MGWRDYDAKIGRFLVADEYEGEDTNPISFNRYLYAEADPVNNIDPDGYAPKWLKKIAKGVKKTAKVAKATYNFVIGDDIRTLTSKNTKFYQKALSGGTILLNAIPGLGTGVSVATKGTIKGTTAIAKAVKTTTSAKKAATAANKTPKTVAAKSIKSTPKIDESKAVKASNETPKAQPKAPVTPKPERGQPNLLLKLDLQFFAKDTAKGNVVKPNDVVPYRPSSSPLENHHGVLDVWAKHNVPNYQSRGANTPTIALTEEQHDATKEVYRNWLFDKTGKKVGGQINWTKISPKEMQSLSERMFDAANVPQSARQEYYRTFNQYNYRE